MVLIVRNENNKRIKLLGIRDKIGGGMGHGKEHLIGLGDGFELGLGLGLGGSGMLVGVPLLDEGSVGGADFLGGGVLGDFQHLKMEVHGVAHWQN